MPYHWLIDYHMGIVKHSSSFLAQNKLRNQGFWARMEELDTHSGTFPKWGFSCSYKIIDSFIIKLRKLFHNFLRGEFQFFSLTKNFTCQRHLYPTTSWNMTGLFFNNWICMKFTMSTYFELQGSKWDCWTCTLTRFVNH